MSRVAIGSILASLWRSAVASGVMAWAVGVLPPAGIAGLDLVRKVGTGLVSYGGALLTAWRLAGAPDGPRRFFPTYLVRLGRLSRPER